MSSLAIYSTDYDPELLYHNDGFQWSIDDQIRQCVRTGDRPLDLLVDLDARRILWVFKAERTTTTTRTGYFLADYRGEDSTDLFEGFAAALREVHNSSGWSLPYTADSQWEAGFNLWRVDPAYPNLTGDEIENLKGVLQEKANREGQLTFGMQDVLGALQTIKALERDGIPCTVAVGTEDNRAPLQEVDVLLDPRSNSDFDPRTPAGREIVALSQTTATTERYERHSIASRIAGAALVVLLGLSAYSFVSASPVHPITGLAAVGWLLGATMGYALIPRRSATGSILTTARERLVSDTDRTLIVLAYGTTLAFGFPTLFRVAGVLLRGESWIFGAVDVLGNALLSTAVFVAVLLVVHLGISFLVPNIIFRGHSRNATIRGLLVSHLVYGIGLVVLTGFAKSAWYGLIPSAG